MGPASTVIEMTSDRSERRRKVDRAPGRAREFFAIRLFFGQFARDSARARFLL